MSFKIASWNVNSLRVRLPQVLEWLAAEQPDVIVLQETKIPDPDFPVAEINQAGYQCVYSGQRTYNGVAVLSRKTCVDPVTDFPELDDHQRRIMGVTLGDLRILNLYVPNGESVVSEKYQYKLNWLQHLKQFLQNELTRHKKIIILGDFNIAPDDIDVHDPEAWRGQVLFSDKERAMLKEIFALGFQDCFRALHPTEKKFSWWDYRMNSFKRNRGLRIDHILASDELMLKCLSCDIDQRPREAERPSDHAIVFATFDEVC